MQRPLREIIEDNGLTLKEVAEASGAGYSTLANFIKGKTDAGDDLLKKLAKYFKIPPDEIANPQPKEDDYLHEGARIPEDVWRRRALHAEQELADIRLALHQLLERSSTRYQAAPPVSSARAGGAGELLDAEPEAAESRSSPKLRH